MNASRSFLLQLIAAVALAAILAVPFPAPAQEQAPVQQYPVQNQAPPYPNTRPAGPGSINYVEGQASLDGQPLSSQSVGSAQMQAGQTLTTQPGGKVEVLLTPGVF